MLDEGIAREVVNRIQRLRKKAALQPSDLVNLQYTVEPASHDLSRIIAQHQDYIETTTKNPISTQSQEGTVLVEENYELKGAKLTLKITKGSDALQNCLDVTNVDLKAFGTPIVPFVNVIYKNKCGVVLLENPVGSNQLVSTQQLSEQIAQLFDLSKSNALVLYSDPKCKDRLNVSSVQELNGQTIYLTPTKGATNDGRSACCPFTNVTFGPSKACLLLQNPMGNHLESVKNTLEVIFQKPVKKVDNMDVSNVNLEKASGKTLQIA